jgi:hypothetical protein
MMGKFGNLGVAVDRPQRMTITWDSEPGRKFDQAQQREQVRKGFRQRSRADLRNEAENIDIVKDQAERLAALATGWHLVGTDRKVILDEKGEPLKFSKADALELFNAPETGWLRRLAWTYIGNETNFMPRSSSNSSNSPSTNSGSNGAQAARPNAST